MSRNDDAENKAIEQLYTNHRHTIALVQPKHTPEVAHSFTADEQRHALPPLPTAEHVRTAILAVHQQLMASFAQCDGLGVAAVYAENGQLLPAYSTAISGRAAIRAFWQGWIDVGIRGVQRTPREVDCLCDTVNEVGEYRILDRHSRVLDVGKYVVIWKQPHGQWKIQHDIWTSNLPPAQ